MPISIPRGTLTPGLGLSEPAAALLFWGLRGDATERKRVYVRPVMDQTDPALGRDAPCRGWG